jgi:hypothetical protein
MAPALKRAARRRRRESREKRRQTTSRRSTSALCRFVFVFVFVADRPSKSQPIHFLFKESVYIDSYSPADSVQSVSHTRWAGRRRSRARSFSDAKREKK